LGILPFKGIFIKILLWPIIFIQIPRYGILKHWPFLIKARGIFKLNGRLLNILKQGFR